MNFDRKHTLKEVGWDGFRASVPAPWEAERIGKNYILLENEGDPVLEAKWDVVKGKFAPDAYLNKLKRAMPKGRDVRSWTVPRNWTEALGQFESEGFQWRSSVFSGKGLIIFCKCCRRATLLQFYERQKKGERKPPPTDRSDILYSFRDHSVDGEILWSLFDIRLVLPEKFALLRHSFTPGAFELEFDAGTFKVSFHRWSPASIILSEHSLEDFARRVFSVDSKDRFSKRESDDSKMVEYQSLPPLSSVKKMSMKFRGKPVYVWIKIWHEPFVNRILGVKAQSAEPFDIENLKKICDHYEIVQDTR